MNTFIFLFGLLAGCLQQKSTYTDMAEKQMNYDNHKSHFDSIYISHFPTYIHPGILSISNALNFENNDVGLWLYEFELNNKVLDSIIISTEKMNMIKKYKSSDLDLLYVIPKGTGFINSRHLDTNVDYSKQLPVLDLNYYLEQSEYFHDYLNNDFDIYVLEAKAGKIPQYPKLRPNMTMPNNWRNGFSRGICISRTGKAVIYWTVFW